MNKVYLFAYGTLRKDCQLAGNEKGDLLFTGQGKINAVMYDLGDYPCAVKSNAKSQITGDVLEVTDSEKVFRALDEYEGNEYERGLETVHMISGVEITAWVYWYKGKPEETNKIENGDYLAYRKLKDSLR